MTDPPGRTHTTDWATRERNWTRSANGRAWRAYGRKANFDCAVSRDRPGDSTSFSAVRTRRFSASLTIQSNPDTTDTYNGTTAQGIRVSIRPEREGVVGEAWAVRISAVTASGTFRCRRRVSRRRGDRMADLRSLPAVPRLAVRQRDRTRDPRQQDATGPVRQRDIPGFVSVRRARTGWHGDFRAGVAASGRRERLRSRYRNRREHRLLRSDRDEHSRRGGGARGVRTGQQKRRSPGDEPDAERPTGRHQRRAGCGRSGARDGRTPAVEPQQPQPGPVRDVDRGQPRYWRDGRGRHVVDRRVPRRARPRPGHRRRRQDGH